MNLSDTARTEGWRAALSVRGRTLAVGSMAGPTVVALVETVPPVAGEFDVAPNVENVARVGILRDDLRPILTAEETVPGVVLYSAENLTAYRVTSVRDQPADIAVRLTCQVSAQP